MWHILPVLEALRRAVGPSLSHQGRPKCDRMAQNRWGDARRVFSLSALRRFYNIDIEALPARGVTKWPYLSITEEDL